MKKHPHLIIVLFLVLVAVFVQTRANAQGTAADYDRAAALKARYESAAIDIAGNATWIGNTNRFWYRKLSKGVNEFIIVDAQTLQKRTAFGREKIAAALSKLLGNTYKSQDLNLTGLPFDDTAATFFATVDGTAVRCMINDSVCTKVEIPTRGPGQRTRAPIKSPDGKWEALINNFNVAVRAVGSRVSQLIKHNKDFDLLVVPGANHGAARSDRYAAYGDHKRYDFFVKHLLGVNPPPWNQKESSSVTSTVARDEE